jgi:hypothetical protein
VVKQRESGRVVGIEQRIIFGNEETIEMKDVNGSTGISYETRSGNNYL